MSIGERIRILREARHLKQGELAEMIGGDGNTISRWERDKLGIGSAYIRRLAQALNTSTDYLMGNTDDPSPQPSSSYSEPPAEERSVVEKSNSRKLTYTFENGEKLELPDTDKGYALFEKILMRKAVMA